MNKLAVLPIILAFLLVIPIVQAAVISGNIYDINLNPAKNTVIKITTTPEQTYVSKDSTYMLSIPEGKYIITATYEKDSTKYSYKKEIRVVEEGTYVLDLILYPGDIGDIPVEEPQKSYSYVWFYFLIIVIISLIAFIIYKFKPKLKKKPVKKEEDDLTKQVLQYIKDQGGRITQKDIRKKFPASEAKISLIITELEHKGTVEKIKKGRGNIIILKQ